jgi:hypothetical protein
MNDRKITKYWFGRDVDGSGRGLVSNVKIVIHTAATVSVFP